MWFIIGGLAFMISAVLSDSRLRGKYAAMFLLGASMLVVGTALV